MAIAMKVNICVFLLVLLHYTQSKVINLSCEQIKAFVDGHNNRRFEVASGNVDRQPAASEMNMVQWDNELAAKASKWASSRRFENNPDLTIKSGRFTVGENLAKWKSKNMTYELDVSKVVTAWFEENKNYTYGPLQTNDPSTYTQMVWSNSTYIGCGMAQDKTSESVRFYVVCYYGPAGNYLNEKPYKSGEASYELLCAASNKDCRHSYGDKC